MYSIRTALAWVSVVGALVSTLEARPAGRARALEAITLLVSTVEIDVAPDTVDLTRPVVSVAHAPRRQRRMERTAPGRVVPATRTAVLWTATGGGARLTLLDDEGYRVAPSVPVPGASGHALAATPRGFGMLLRRVPTVAGLPDELWLVEVARSGTVLFERRLVGGAPREVIGSEWVDSYFGMGLDRARLLWTGNGFAAYFMLWRRWPDGVSYQGDTLRYYDALGNPAGAAFSWGLSHSLDLRLAKNGAVVASVGLSDCYPAKAILWSLNPVLSAEPSGNCAGLSSARLGGLISGVDGPAPTDGFWLTYLSSTARPTADVALLRIGPTGTVLSRDWLMSDSQVESAPHLAWITVGSQRRPLAAWRNEDGTHVLLVPGALPQPILESFPDTEDFVSYPDGSAGWVWAWGETDRLKSVRVREGS